jgi:hypothetical protein
LASSAEALVLVFCELLDFTLLEDGVTELEDFTTELLDLGCC